MKKRTLNYILFWIMFLLGIIQAISGFLLWLVIPSGSRGGGGGSNVFIWHRETWISIHDWTAVALIVIIFIHIILHWDWILTMTQKMLGMNVKVEEDNE